MAKYVALKRLNVQELNPDGTPKLDDDGRPVTRVCMPGDPVPEAVHWKNLDKYIRTGHIGLEGLGLTGPGLAETIARQRQRHPEEGRRVRRRRAAKPAARAPETVPPDEQESDTASVSGDLEIEPVPATESAEPEGEAVAQE